MEQTHLNPARTLCFAAVAAVLTFIMTVFPKVPIPLGYAHLGDAVIFLAALYMGRREAGLAAAIGSALADLLGGFPIWIIPTLIIKYVMVEIVSRSAGDNWKLLSLPVLVGFVLSSLWMAAAYTLAGAAIYGSLAAGLTSTPGLLLEGLINTVAAFAAGAVLVKAGFRLPDGVHEKKPLPALH